MEVVILSINSIEGTNSFSINTQVGNINYLFTFCKRIEYIGKHKLYVYTHDKLFGEVFKYNQQAISPVMNLLKDVSNKIPTELPKIICEFYEGIP